MQVRRVRVQVETERLRIVGTLQLPTEGYRSRTTDFLNAHETGFIALTDATVEPIDGSPSVPQDFIAVGCRHIAAVVEVEDLGVIEEELTLPPAHQPPPRPPDPGTSSVPPPG